MSVCVRERRGARRDEMVGLQLCPASKLSEEEALRVGWGGGTARAR